MARARARGRRIPAVAASGRPVGAVAVAPRVGVHAAPVHLRRAQLLQTPEIRGRVRPRQHPARQRAPARDLVPRVQTHAHGAPARARGDGLGAFSALGDAGGSDGQLAPPSGFAGRGGGEVVGEVELELVGVRGYGEGGAEEGVVGFGLEGGVGGEVVVAEAAVEAVE